MIQFFVPKLQDMDDKTMPCAITRNDSITVLVIFSCNFSFWWSELTDQIVRFNTVALFSSLKSKIYATTTHNASKEEIERCVIEIQPHLCKIRSWKVSTKERRQSRGYTIPYITYTLRIDKKFTIFNHKFVFSIKITSCLNFGTLFTRITFNEAN